MEKGKVGDIGYKDRKDITALEDALSRDQTHKQKSLQSNERRLLLCIKNTKHRKCGEIALPREI